MTKTESRKLTDEYQQFTLEEFQAGRLDFDTYCKVLLQISAEYLIEFGDEEACLVTLNKVPEIYLTGTMPAAMTADPLFAVQMVEFAHHLERSGITFEVIPAVTQGAANA